VWFNPDLYSRNYFVPGVIADIIMMVTLMLTALGRRWRTWRCTASPCSV
jgi:hypothetical protein